MELLNFNQVELLKNLGILLWRGKRRLLFNSDELYFPIALGRGGF